MTNSPGPKEPKEAILEKEVVAGSDTGERKRGVRPSV